MSGPSSSAMLSHGVFGVKLILRSILIIRNWPHYRYIVRQEPSANLCERQTGASIICMCPISHMRLLDSGRGDATPPNNNVFSFVAAAANWTNQNVSASAIPYNNFTASGYFDTDAPAPIPAVITNYTGPGGKGVLPSLKGVNGSAINPPSSSSSASASGGAAASGSAAATSKSAAVHQFTFSSHVLVGMVCVSVAFFVGLLA